MGKTIEENKLIALFMGYTEDEIQAEVWCGCNVLAECAFTGEKSMVAAAYDSNWSWLMAVVEKIANLYEGDAMGHVRYIRIAKHLSIPNITEAWEAVVDFIKWYNTAQPNLSAAPTAQPQSD